ncbi:MAG: TraR/DksA family transcriptional regulator [Bacteroidetes bacterium HGW-Bacteroidetes-12]|nr:MAG: TraR/DksA family transcriptional regulator [Bacteroidetes bacterium HGW-Bacteroidetes-12]
MTNEEIKQKIIDEISKTEKLIIEYQEMTKPVAPDVAIGRISRMDAINNKAVTESALRQAQEKLNKLKYVLSKIGSEDFGICMKCKTKIPVGRILIRPESMYCVNCAK